MINVPNTGDTSMARIMIEGNGNIFYAVNAANLSIQASEFVITANTPSVDVCSPTDAVFNLTYNTFLGFTETTTFSVSGLPAGASGLFTPATATADATAVVLTVSGIGAIATGSYLLVVTGTSGAIMKSTNITMNVFASTLDTPTLITHSNGAVDVPADETLTWSVSSNTEDYLVEIATDSGFSNIVTSTTVQTNSYVTSLSSNTEYFWRVTPSNQCSLGTTSSVFSFTTANITCNSFDATDLPQTITTVGSNVVYTSTINVGPNFPITDVNVTFSATHTYDGDLDVFLISPTGTRVELTTDNGGTNENYIDTVFDQEASTSITSGSAPYTGTFIPEGDLSTLYGELSAGAWVLEVTDDTDLDGGTFDRFTLNLCVQGDVLSTDNLEGSLANLFLYPNPSNGSFILSFDTDSNDKVKLQLFDITGRMVREESYRDVGFRFSERVPFKGVSSGLYLLRISNGSKLSTRKVVVK